MKRDHVAPILIVVVVATIVLLASSRIGGPISTCKDSIDRDAYTWNVQGDANHGGDTTLVCGGSACPAEAYFHATLTNRPASFRSARLWFRVWPESPSMPLKWWTIPSDWTESTITGTNRPGAGSLVEYIAILRDGSGWYSIDVSGFVRSTPEVSFRVNATADDMFVWIYAREHGAQYGAYIEYTIEGSPWLGRVMIVILGFIAAVLAIAWFKHDEARACQASRASHSKPRRKASAPRRRARYTVDEVLYRRSKKRP